MPPKANSPAASDKQPAITLIADGFKIFNGFDDSGRSPSQGTGSFSPRRTRAGRPARKALCCPALISLIVLAC